MTVFVFCKDYSPTGINPVQPDTIQPTIKVNLMDPVDSLTIVDSVVFTYEQTIGQGIFGFLRVELDSVAIDTVYDGQHYTFDSTPFPDGFHTMQFTVFAVPQPYPDVASFFHKQFKASYSVSFTVNISNHTQPKIERAKFKIVNGRGELSWPAVKVPGFIRYEIKRSYPPLPGFATYYISDWTKNKWIDRDYVGGSVKYRVDLVANGYESIGKEVNVDYPVPKILQAEPFENGIRIVWSPCVADSNLQRYTLYVNDVRAIQFYEFQTSYLDTTIQFGSTNYRLETSSGINGHTISAEPYRVEIGNACPPFTQIEYVPEYQSYFLSHYDENGGKFLRLGMSYSILNSAHKYGMISKNGKYACLVPENIAAKSIIRIDPLSFLPQEDMKIKVVPGSLPPGINIDRAPFFISDKGLLFHIYYSFWNGHSAQKGINVFDLEKKSHVSFLAGQFEHILLISRNGRFAITLSDKIQMWEVFNQFFDERWQTISFKALDFIQDETLVSLEHDQIKVFDNLTSRDTRFSIETSGSILDLTVDEESNHVGVLNTDWRFQIYDLDNGRLTKEIQVSPNPETRFVLINSTLFSSDGLYLPLNLE
jgi:hypothetical protein